MLRLQLILRLFGQQVREIKIVEGRSQRGECPEGRPGVTLRRADEDVQVPRVAHGETCGTSVYLWNGMTAVVAELKNARGRRAMLVIGDDQDDGSVITSSQLHRYAGVEGVALFGLRDFTVWSALRGDQGDVFDSLCRSTGGIVMRGTKTEVRKRMLKWISLLRGRYILEFPEPTALGLGRHEIAVSIKGDGNGVCHTGGCVDVAA